MTDAITDDRRTADRVTTIAIIDLDRSSPADFAAMVGPDAALIGSRTGVYVRVVPETLRTASPWCPRPPDDRGVNGLEGGKTASEEVVE